MSHTQDELNAAWQKLNSPKGCDDFILVVDSDTEQVLSTCNVAPFNSDSDAGSNVMYTRSRESKEQSWTPWR